MFLMLSSERERYKIQLMRLKFVVWSFYSKGEWSKNSYSGGCCASSTSYFVSLSLEQLARQGQLQSLFCFFIVAKIHSWQDSFFVVTNGRDYHKGVMRSKQTGELGLDLIRSKKIWVWGLDIVAYVRTLSSRSIVRLNGTDLCWVFLFCKE